MKHTISLVTVAFALAACSNGGGSAPPASNRPEVSIAEIQPSAQSVAPPGTVIQVVFGEDVDAATLTPDGLRVEDASGSLPGTYAYDSARRAWTFTPKDGLPRGQTVHTIVTTQVRSVAGRSLSQDRVVEFRVQDGTVLQPVDLGVAELGPVRSAAMHGGTALIAHGTSLFEFTSAAVSAPATMPAPVRALHMTRTGEAAALLTTTGINSFRVEVARRSLAGVWGTPVLVTEQNRLLGNVALRGNGRGDLLVRWAAVFGVPQVTIEGTLRSEFATPSRFDAVDVGPPQLGRLFDLDGTGQLFHGLQDGNGVRILRTGSAAALDLPVAAPFAQLEGLVADGQGRMLTVYRTGSGATEDLRSRRYVPGTGLEPEQVCFAGTASVAALQSGERGDAAAVLVVPGAAGNELWGMTWLARTGDWTPARPIQPGAIEFHDGGFTAMAISPRGVAWLACVVQRGTSQELLLSRAQPGGAFETPRHVDITPTGVRLLRPALAVDEQGRCVVLWQTRTITSTLTGSLRTARFE